MADGQMEIILNDWTGGMGNDEYTGSFFYGENIDISKNSRAFKLSNRVVNTTMNYRSSGYYNKILLGPNNYEVLGLSQDGLIEGNQLHYENAPGFSGYGGFLYKRASGGYKNGINIGDYLIALTATDKLDAFKISGTNYGYGIRGSELLLNPDLDTSDNWTVSGTGTGWSFGSSGATHTVGNTETLAQTITPGVGTGRLCLYISNWTTGTLTPSYDGGSLGAISITTNVPQNKWYCFNITTSASDDVVLTPSSDFDGRVQFISVRKYDSTKIQSDLALSTHGSYTDFDTRPIIYDGGILYIASLNKIETVDTTLTLGSWVVETGLELQSGDKIIGITKIGDVFNIYANNGTDGIKYIWNGVDELPQEKILWKNKPFLSVDSDGNNDYVICGSTYNISLYVSNGYQKQKITQSGYMANADNNYDAYRLENRFDFKKIIGFSDDTVWLGGYYGVYTFGKNIPGLPDSAVKEFAINNTIDTYLITSQAYSNGLPYICYRTLNKTYNYNSIGLIRQRNYNYQGYLVTNPLLFDNLSTEKLIKKFKIGYLLPSSTCSINIYARVNDNYYYTFDVSGLTTTPTVGAIYTNYSSNVFEVVKTNITAGAGTITCAATSMLDTGFSYGGTLTKTSGTGDASITYTDRDNFVLVKTITTDKYRYGEDEIFPNSFIDIGMPDVFKLQLKIELLSTSASYSPEVYDIQVLSDIKG